MSIRWDSLLVRHVARELHETLGGHRLRAIRLDGSSRDIALLFRERTLLWRLHPERGLPLLRPPIDPEGQDLRFNTRLRAVTSPPDERIIRFEFTGGQAGQGAIDVIVELLGNQMNALVVEGPSRTIRHVLQRRDGGRPAHVGSPYHSPPSSGRRGVDGALSSEEWEEILALSPPGDRARALTRSVAWMSPINAGAFLEAPQQGRKIWSAAATGAISLAPVVLETDRGAQPYPFVLSGYEARHVDTLLGAFEVCAQERAAGGDATPALAISPELLAMLEATILHVERRIVRLEAELAGREDPQTLRSLGDLILARYRDVPVGAAHVLLQGFSGEDVSVQLDPTLAVHQNATSYYDRAGRSERAAERIPRLVEKAVRERDRLRELLDRVSQGTASADEVRSALPKTPVRRARGDVPPALPYRTFRSSGGLEIRVGRGSRHNDDLTFRHSAPNDVWLHARHTAGAHVILRWPGPGNPPARDLEEAGTLAAIHSKGRTSATVPVDWTFRKYVRKPRGAPPGSVVPDRVKTVFVRPDAALTGVLADNDS